MVPRRPNFRGNGNEAKADIDQSNDVDQSQSSTQKQNLDGEVCCKRGSDQTATQKTYFGDQTVEKQKNDGDVTQKQGNDNVAFSPALSFGAKHDACNSTCTKSGRGSYGHRGDAETANYQGNGNEARAEVDQKNDVDQSQDSYQRQSLVEACKQLVT